MQPDGTAAGTRRDLRLPSCLVPPPDIRQGHPGLAAALVGERPGRVLAQEGSEAEAASASVWLLLLLLAVVPLGLDGVGVGAVAPLFGDALLRLAV